MSDLAWPKCYRSLSANTKKHRWSNILCCQGEVITAQFQVLDLSNPYAWIMSQAQNRLDRHYLALQVVLE